MGLACGKNSYSSSARSYFNQPIRVPPELTPYKRGPTPTIVEIATALALETLAVASCAARRNACSPGGPVTLCGLASGIHTIKGGYDPWQLHFCPQISIFEKRDRNFINLGCQAVMFRFRAVGSDSRAPRCATPSPRILC